MIPPVSAVASLLQGLRQSTARMTRAANVIARSGLERPPEPSTPATLGASREARDSTVLPGATIDLLVAQRAVSAQLRALETAERMADEATRLGANRG